MLLRIYSILFTLLLGLFLAALGTLTLATGTKNVKLDMLPFWKGDTALYGVAGLGLAGIICVILAYRRQLKFLFVLYTLATFCLIVYGYFISPVYKFQGAAEAKSVIWLACAALVAFLGSLTLYQKPERA
jgi:hypothetical protein